MPNNTLIFLRHAETKVNKDLAISKWILTEYGKESAINLFKLDLLEDVDLIITSDEEKAFQTAFPLAEKLKKEIIRDKKLNEIMRDKGKFLKKDEYLKTMKLCMTNKNQSFNNWETAENALKRFSKEIEEIDSRYSNKYILIVSHGGVINLYFAKILGKLNNVFSRALSNSFCDYGIIQDGKIIKDIANIPN
ncbi:MAG: histidine phosphatase family protein [Promethearchaeota archaeon]